MVEIASRDNIREQLDISVIPFTLGRYRREVSIYALLVGVSKIIKGITLLRPFLALRNLNPVFLSLLFEVILLSAFSGMYWERQLAHCVDNASLKHLLNFLPKQNSQSVSKRNLDLPDLFSRHYK